MRSVLILIAAFSILRGSVSPKIRTEQPSRSSVLAVFVLDSQEIAQSRADYMARHNLRSHPPAKAGNWKELDNATFEGVGWAKSDRVPTCRPSGRSSWQDDDSRVLLGDAVSQSRYGYFRVRIWGKQK